MNKSIKFRKIFLFGYDIFLIIVSYFVIYLLLKMNLTVGAYTKHPQWKHFLMIIFCITLVRVIFRTYGSIWRYADTMEYLLLIAADFFGCCLCYCVDRYIIKLGLPGYFITGVCMLSLLLVLASRFLYRQLKLSRNNISKDEKPQKPPVYAAIVGAGYAGVALLEELRRNGSNIVPYCFIDNDNSKVGSTIRGIKVYGVQDTIVEFIKDSPVSEIIIAIPSLPTIQRNELISKCTETGCKVRVYEYAYNRMSTEQCKKAKLSIREINILDLLCRDEVSFDITEVRNFIADKTVLVTGAGGSIGSELCRQISLASPKKLILLDIYENNVYGVQQELAREYGSTLDFSVEIASVRDSDKIDYIFSKYRPDLVFHAAAHKHVPLMEDCIDEAIKNNIFGTYNVVSSSEKYGVSKMLLISTDKAVNPTSVMGATKRFCEMIVQSKKNSKTEYVAVRFGNVLGSNGSVIPLFTEQIKNGGPVTITDKRITRYFMTIPEAVSLVLQTGTMAAKSEIFVLDMGEPVKILDLAEKMIKLAGYKPYHDIDIVEIGLRPGEKLFEELLIKTEELDRTANKKIFIERDGSVSELDIHKNLKKLKTAVEKKDSDYAMELLHEIIPTFLYPENTPVNAEAAMK